MITLVFHALSAAPVFAADITVDSTCTLAQAINEANGATTGVGSCEAGATGADTIKLTGDVSLTATLPTITSNITIEGGDHTLSATGRAINVTGTPKGTTPETYDATTLTINDLTLTNINSSSAVDGLISLDQRASLEINGSTFNNIKAQKRGAAIELASNSDDLTISDSTFSNISNNLTTGTASGNAIVAIGSGNTVTISDSIFRNITSRSEGSALYVQGGVNLDITGSRFSDNASSRNGGAISTADSSTTLTVRNSVFDGNTAGFDGGAIVVGTGTANIYRSFFSGNQSTEWGGAISAGGTLLVENSTFYNNRSTTEEGGAVNSGSSGTTTTIRHVTFVNNEATDTGADGNGNAVYFFPPGAANMYNSIIVQSSSATGTSCEGLDINTKNIIQAGHSTTCATDSDLGTDPKLGSRVTPSSGLAYYPLLADSLARDGANGPACLALEPVNNLRVDQLGRSRAVGSACDVGAWEWHPPPPSPPGGAGSGVSGSDGDAALADAPGTQCVFCDELIASGLRLYARTGLDSGVQFRRVEAAAIGDQSLLAAGFMDAVDVYGWAEQGVGVCFPASGRLLFLDAASSPRAIVPLDGYRQDGMTCAEFARPGTLLLLSGDPPTAQRAGSPAAVRGWKLSNCMVTLNYLLNFRQSPGGERLHYVDPWGAQIAGWLPYNVTLTALERTADWFKVDYHGTRGYVSARHVTTHGTCG